MCRIKFCNQDSLHFVIGELAPLLSVLGHEKHKRHKSASDLLPDWECCAVSVFHVVPCQFLPSSIILSTYHAFIVTMYAFQCKYECRINLVSLFYGC